MTATVETKIWQALKARVLTQPLSFPLAMPTEDYTPPVVNSQASPYIEVRHLPNRLTRMLIDSDGPVDRPGILQLMLCVPVALKMSFEVAQEYAGQLAAHFACDLRLEFQGATVRVDQPPDVAQPYREDDCWHWPVTIRWHCYA